MESLTVQQAAEKWGLAPRTVQQLCTQGRIPGAQKFGKSWAIPADTEKPETRIGRSIRKIPYSQFPASR